jgi:hypothetical protein
MGVDEGLIASTAFFVGGLSILSREAAHATARTTIPLLLLSGIFMFSISANRSTSVVLSAGSVPFVNGLCLVSYRDVAEAVGQGTFSYPGTMMVLTNEGAGRVLGTYLVAVAGYAAAAAWYTRAAFARFDRVAGRPERAAADRGRRSASQPKFDEQFASDKRVGSWVR